MGRYDIPASVDYILEKTGHSKLSFVGYSLGSALFFVSAVQSPQLNDKIQVMIGMGPTARVTTMYNIFYFVAPLDVPMQVCTSPFIFIVVIDCNYGTVI